MCSPEDGLHELKRSAVEIVPYDLSWPRLFEEERKKLLQTIGGWLTGSVEHIGSTSIPGLAAKPVIDILAGVDTLEASRPAIAALAEMGYGYTHLHLVPFGSLQWIAPIAFRDYVRAHPQIAAEYQVLKERLARDFRFDREAYTEAKGLFVMRMTNLALQERDDIPLTRL